MKTKKIKLSQNVKNLLLIFGILVVLAVLAFKGINDKVDFSFLRAQFSATKPSIVFIVTDDQRADTLQYMPKTKELLIDQGVNFTNAFVSFPLCCPSRASILTGLYVHNHGIWTNTAAQLFKDTGLDQSTVATWLQNNGYRTGLIGKYLNDYDKVMPNYQPPGWTEWDANGWTGTRMPIIQPTIKNDTSSVPAAKAVGFIQRTPPGQPFFIYLALTAPHSPASSPNSDFSLFANISPWNPPSFNEADVSDKPSWIKNLSLLTQTKQDSIQLFRKKQLASLQGVDRAVERIVNTLIAENRINDTIIIFTSDHGYFWGEHRLDGKGKYYEEALRIPLVIRVPGIAPRVETQLVQNIDFAPTMADFSGVAPASKVNGVSLKPLLEDPSTPALRDGILMEQGAKHYGVRTDRYKYAERGSQKEFYDLLADPYELTNVVSDPSYVQIISDLKAKLNVLKAQ